MMKAISKMSRLAVLSAGLVAALTLLALPLSGRSDSAAESNPPLLVGIDVDPAGNSCPGTGDEDCTLGPIDQCIAVPNAPGERFTVDTFVEGLTDGFLAWNHNLGFPDTTTPAKLTLTAQTETSATVNLMVQSEGSVPFPASEPVPDAYTPHNAGVAEVGTREATPPFTHGVLGRYEFTVGAGATSGVYGLTLAGAPLDCLVNHKDDLVCMVVDQIWDANFSPQYGLVALGVPCPQAGGTPTPSPSPTPSPTATPTPIPPPNDDFADAAPVTALPFTNLVLASAATLEPGEPQGCGTVRKTVWYSFAPERDTYLQANAAGSSPGAVLAVYTGDTLGSLTRLACGSNELPRESMLGFVANAGTTHYFQVGGEDGQLGLNVTLAHDADVRLNTRGSVVRNGETKRQVAVIRNVGGVDPDQFRVLIAVGARDGCTASVDDPMTPLLETGRAITTFASVPAGGQTRIPFDVTYLCLAPPGPDQFDFGISAGVWDVHDLDPYMDNNFAWGTQDLVGTSSWRWGVASGLAP